MAKKTISLSPWPWPDRPRVLIESPDPEASLAAAALRQAGYAVAICHGPTRNERCPLVGSDDCALVIGADVVVSGVGPEVEEAVRRRHPGTPLVASADPDALVAAVGEALGGRRS